MSDNIHRWLAAGEVGLSSKTMALVALGVDPTDRYGRVNHPNDPDDLMRCVKLLNVAPEVRDTFPKIAALSPEWKGLIGEWDELVALMWEECPTGRGNAPKTYERMKRHMFNPYAPVSAVHRRNSQGNGQ